MRLLNVSTLEIESGFPDVDLSDSKNQLWYNASNSRPRPRYSILSHRWAEEEITFQNFNQYKDLLHSMKSSGQVELPSGSTALNVQVLMSSIHKVVGACKQTRAATGNQLTPANYIWIDTVCINKEDGDETRLAINSMFRWYAEADMCFVYLADVIWYNPQDSINQFRASQWFRRGWTLQELIASRNIQFFDRDCRYMGSKTDLADIISAASEISPQHLLGDFRTASLGQKMSWLARRETKYIEDRAYCMLGIFGVFLDPRYGQGDREFARLQIEIVKTWDKTTPFDETLFAWTTDKVVSSGLFAPAPSCFENCSDVVFVPGFTKGRGTIATGAFWESTAPVGISLDDSQQLTVQVPYSHGLPKWVYLLTCGILAWCTMLPKDAFEKTRGSRNVQLNCWRRLNDGSFQAAQVSMQKYPTGIWQRVNCGELSWSSSVKLYPPQIVASVSAAILQIPNQFEFRS